MRGSCLTSTDGNASPKRHHSPPRLACTYNAIIGKMSHVKYSDFLELDYVFRQENMAPSIHFLHCWPSIFGQHAAMAVRHARLSAARIMLRGKASEVYQAVLHHACSPYRGYIVKYMVHVNYVTDASELQEWLNIPRPRTSKKSGSSMLESTPSLHAAATCVRAAIPS